MEPAATSWVLVCDDTASIRLLIRINLELSGFEVVEASDGSVALALLRANLERPPVVLVLDVQMEPMDGWETLAAMRREAGLTGIRVVMVTASLQQGERERAETAGVDAFLAKPFEPEELVDVVQRLAG